MIRARLICGIDDLSRTKSNLTPPPAPHLGRPGRCVYHPQPPFSPKKPCTPRTSVYNVHMGVTQVAAWECDRCGYIWLKVSGSHPTHCPNRKCRTRRWDVSSTNEVRCQPEQVLMLHNPTCEKCGGATVTWGGMMVRCVKCSINYPL